MVRQKETMVAPYIEHHYLDLESFWIILQTKNVLFKPLAVPWCIFNYIVNSEYISHMLGKTIKEHFSHIHSFNVIQRRQEGYLVLIREPPSLEIKASDRSLYSFQGSNPRPPAWAVSVALQSVSSFSSRSNLGDPLGDRGVGKAEELARRVRTSGNMPSEVSTFLYRLPPSWWIFLFLELNLISPP